jgi:predicted permease
VGRAQAELNAMFVPITTTGPAAIFKPDDAPRITLPSAANGLASLRTEYKRPLGVLMAAVGLILLLASANVAGLALARSSARQKEMALRNALGAPRLRIVRQLLTESLMLSFAGGSLGILLAEFAAKALVSFLSANSYVPLHIDVGIDWHVFGFTMLVSTVVGILFGLAPALRGSRIDVAPALKLTGGPASPTPPRSSRLSNVLVVAQVVIALLVLVGAGLLGRTVLNLEGANAGFKTGNLLLFNVDMTASGLKIDDPRCDKLNEELQNRFAALPGVSSVSYSIMPLLSGGYSASPFRLPGTPVSSAHTTYVLLVGSRFFETMGIPLVAGRTFTRADFESSAKPKPIVVSRAFTRAFFGDENPLGRRVIEGDPGPDAGEWQIIGVVGDTKNESVRSEIEPTAFEPEMYRQTTFELRTQNNPNPIASLVREAASQANPDYLILDMMTQNEEIDRTIYQERLTATLSTLFGLLALTLSVIGLYGLVAYGVARRTHEIGVRMALGAQRQKILWLTARLGLVLTLIGVVIGLAVAAGVTHYLQSLLYGVRPVDSWTFACMSILLGCIAAVACYIPARRAMRVDPMVALRHE